MSVRPSLSYHLVSANRDGLVEGISEMSRTDLRVNGGFFAFQQDIFDYIHEGEELVHEPFQRLIQRKQLLAYPYDGFFASMDTFKDKQNLDDLCAAGNAPWQVWRTHNGNGAQAPETLTTPDVIRIGAAD
jgi:glucose-1-phosphate cytidylyltransferase